MEMLDVPIVLPKGHNKIVFHCLSDLHRSAEGCDSAKFRSDVNKIRTARERGEIHYWWGGGDLVNGISVKDKRYDSTAVAKEFHEHLGEDLHQAESRVVARELEPIREWGVGIGSGNHEKAVSKYNEFNPATDIAERLNLPYLGYSAFLRFRISQEGTHKEVNTLIVYWHHGRGAGRTKGSKVNAMTSFEANVDADVIVTGHDHEIIDFPSVHLAVTRRGALRLLKKETLFVNSGTYLKAYPVPSKPQKSGQFNAKHTVMSDYAEQFGLRPTVIGHGGFIVHLTHGKQSNNIRLERADFR